MALFRHVDCSDFCRALAVSGGAPVRAGVDHGALPQTDAADDDGQGGAGHQTRTQPAPGPRQSTLCPCIPVGNPRVAILDVVKQDRLSFGARILRKMDAVNLSQMGNFGMSSVHKFLAHV